MDVDNSQLTADVAASLRDHRAEFGEAPSTIVWNKWTFRSLAHTILPFDGRVAYFKAAGSAYLISRHGTADWDAVCAAAFAAAVQEHGLLRAKDFARIHQSQLHDDWRRGR